MKKLLVFILIGCGFFAHGQKDTLVPQIHEQIDVYIPEDVQISIHETYSIARDYWNSLTNSSDTLRERIKVWSLAESENLVAEATDADFIPSSGSFSPILDNSSIIYSSSTSVGQKLYGALLFMITLLFWNFSIFATWVCILAYLLVRSVKKRYFPKRRKSFFDRINEGVKKEMDDDWN